MSFSTAVTARFTKIKDVIPFVFTHGVNVGISGTRTNKTLNLKYEELGSDAQIDYQILALVSDFTATPTIGDKITVGSNTRRILAVDTDVTNGTYIITIGAEYQQ